MPDDHLYVRKKLKEIQDYIDYLEAELDDSHNHTKSLEKDIAVLRNVNFHLEMNKKDSE